MCYFCVIVLLNIWKMCHSRLPIFIFNTRLIQQALIGQLLSSKFMSHSKHIYYNEPKCLFITTLDKWFRYITNLMSITLINYTSLYNIFGRRKEVKNIRKSSKLWITKIFSRYRSINWGKLKFSPWSSCPFSITKYVIEELWCHVPCRLAELYSKKG